jgi:hypothetical protein
MTQRSKPLSLEDVPKELEKDRQRLAAAMLDLRAGKVTADRCKEIMRESDELMAQVKRLMKEAKQRQGKGRK